MRLFVTAVDADGRSAVRHALDVGPAREESFADILFTTSEGPPPTRPPGDGALFPASG